MKKGLLNIGVASSLLIILLQIYGGFYEFKGLKFLYHGLVYSGLYHMLSITVLITLWKVLVKFFKQSSLDSILKAMILVSMMILLLLYIGYLYFSELVSTSAIILSVINVILYFIFIYRIMKIEKTDVHQIEQLKNYSVAFTICFTGQLMLNLITEIFRLKNLDYINHFLILVPFIFIGLFFMRTKHEIKQS